MMKRKERNTTCHDEKEARPTFIAMVKRTKKPLPAMMRRKKMIITCYDKKKEEYDYQP